MAFIEREWKSWVKTEFLTDLKSLLSCTSNEAVRHYLFEVKFKFKTHNVNYLGRDAILYTHNGDKLNKTIAGNFLLGEKPREVFQPWHFYDNFWSLLLLPEILEMFDWYNQNQLNLGNFKGLFFKTFLWKPKNSN